MNQILYSVVLEGISRQDLESVFVAWKVAQSSQSLRQELDTQLKGIWTELIAAFHSQAKNMQELVYEYDKVEVEKRLVTASNIDNAENLVAYLGSVKGVRISSLILEFFVNDENIEKAAHFNAKTVAEIVSACLLCYKDILQGAQFLTSFFEAAFCKRKQTLSTIYKAICYKSWLVLIQLQIKIPT